MIPDAPNPPGFDSSRRRYLRIRGGGLPALLAFLRESCLPHLAFLASVLLIFVLCLVAAVHSNATEVPRWAIHRAEQAPALPAGSWRWVEATAYCPCARCTDGDGITANGTRTARVPYALAADRSLPMGARVYVPPGLGYLDRLRPFDRVFVIDDRGGALDTEAAANGFPRIDLRFRDHADAVRFGRRLLPVFVCSLTR